MPFPTQDHLPRLTSTENLIPWARHLVERLEHNLQEFRFIPTVLQLVNGDNNNVSIQQAQLLRIIGPTAAYTITGLAGGSPGRVVILRNTVAFNLTLAEESVLSEATNRITTQTGVDESTSGIGMLILVYDENRWQFLGGVA